MDGSEMHCRNDLVSKEQRGTTRITMLRSS